jgi:hypothetical protein
VSETIRRPGVQQSTRRLVFLLYGRLSERPALLRSGRCSAHRGDDLVEHGFSLFCKSDPVILDTHQPKLLQFMDRLFVRAMAGAIVSDHLRNPAAALEAVVDREGEYGETFVAKMLSGRHWISRQDKINAALPPYQVRGALPLNHGD